MVTVATTAKSFVLAAERCEEQRQINENQVEVLLIPAVSSRAFSIELYFKAILNREGNETRGHRLDNLFTELLPATQSSIISKLGIAANDFDRSLIAVSNAFVEWRYIHEAQDKDLDYEFIKKLSYAVQDVYLHG